MQENYLKHRPVMVKQVLDNLIVKKNGIYIDATYGQGGHSKAILECINKDAVLYALDKDKKSLQENTIQDNRIHYIKLNFSKIYRYCLNNNLLGKIDGILADIGPSTAQILDPKRGFTFLKNGPLDMRMDQTSRIKASTIIKQYSQKELEKLLYSVNESKGKYIAKDIKLGNIKNTQDLVNIVFKYKTYKKGIHPATKLFLALRIAVNKELQEIKTLCTDSMQILKPGGRLVVISFHSLEDKIVKNIIKQLIIDKKAIKIAKMMPMEQEIRDNKRSRSALLRCIEKI